VFLSLLAYNSFLGSYVIPAVGIFVRSWPGRRQKSKLVYENSALQSKWAEEYFIVCMTSVAVRLDFNESGS
jgi:hypothetical protein